MSKIQKVDRESVYQHKITTIKNKEFRYFDLTGQQGIFDIKKVKE